MIKPLTRKEIFKIAAFTDNFIAAVQQSYSVDVDLTVPWEVAHFKQHFDHVQPFGKDMAPIKGHGVIAFAARDLATYTRQLPKMIISLLAALNCHQVFLMDFIKKSLNDFPFENFRKKNTFKLLAGKHTADVNYLLDYNGIEQILPLFFFSNRYDIPVIYLITADGDIDLAFNLCDDGNLHLHFSIDDEQKILNAAATAGFITGDIDLCSVYFVNKLK